MAAMIAFTWLYGIMAMFPPLVGWNEFVPSASGISCCPNWVPETKAGVAYNALLVFVGFVLPLSVVIFCYYRIYKYVILAVAPYFAREKHGKSRFSVSLCSSTPRKRLPRRLLREGKRERRSRIGTDEDWKKARDLLSREKGWSGFINFCHDSSFLSAVDTEKWIYEYIFSLGWGWRKYLNIVDTLSQ